MGKIIELDVTDAVPDPFSIMVALHPWLRPGDFSGLNAQLGQLRYTTHKERFEDFCHICANRVLVPLIKRVDDDDYSAVVEMCDVFIEELESDDHPPEVDRDEEWLEAIDHAKVVFYAVAWLFDPTVDRTCERDAPKKEIVACLTKDRFQEPWDVVYEILETEDVPKAKLDEFCKRSFNSLAEGPKIKAAISHLSEKNAFQHFDSYCSKMIAWHGKVPERDLADLAEKLLACVEQRVEDLGGSATDSDNLKEVAEAYDGLLKKLDEVRSVYSAPEYIQFKGQHETMRTKVKAEHERCQKGLAEMSIIRVLKDFVSNPSDKIEMLKKVLADHSQKFGDTEQAVVISSAEDAVLEQLLKAEAPKSLADEKEFAAYTEECRELVDLHMRIRNLHADPPTTDKTITLVAIVDLYRKLVTAIDACNEASKQHDECELFTAAWAKRFAPTLLAAEESLKAIEQWSTTHGKNPDEADSTVIASSSEVPLAVCQLGRSCYDELKRWYTTSVQEMVDAEADVLKTLKGGMLGGESWRTEGGITEHTTFEEAQTAFEATVKHKRNKGARK